MAKGFHANTLNSYCFNRAQTCDNYSSLNSYICFGQDEQPNPQSNLQSAGCWYTSSQTSHPNKPRVYGVDGYSYGYTPQDTVSVLPNNYFFSKGELDSKLGEYTMNPYGPYSPYTRKIIGFRYKNNATVIPLKKKYSQYTPYFQNFTNVYWTDWYPPDPDQPDIGSDPLGNIFNDGGPYSAPMMYTRGVSQPFLGENFFEDTGSSIEKSKVAYSMYFNPFCSPIDIYNPISQKVGYADGMSFQVFHFKSLLKNRLFRILDPETYPNKAFLAPYIQYFTIELWAYLSCVGVNSPRIFTQRWWYYTQLKGTDLKTKPCDPYYFIKCGMYPDRYVKFNLLPKNQDATNTSNFTDYTYYTPWTNAKLFLGA